jgi:hypothetical protein
MDFTARVPGAAALALALGALLAACAGRPAPPAGFAPREAAGLFISPAGQPFRARPGEPYPSAAWFAAADRDHDGRLSRDEFVADSLAFFHRLDKDGDGRIDGFETQAYEDSIPEMAPRVGGLRPGEGMNPVLGRRRGEGGGQAAAQARARRPQPRQVRQGAGLFAFLTDPEPVRAADVDFDSRVSLAEARALAERRFALLDADGDGWFTLAEAPPVPVQQLAERQRRNRRPPPVERGSGPSGPPPAQRPVPHP